MDTCNDPKCPLNRQGVSHENHDLIENKEITNPCNDPRCAMNRMGMKHNIHSDVASNEKKIDEVKQETIKQENTTKQNTKDDVNSSGDIMEELSKRIYNDNPNRLSREKIIAERMKRAGQKIQQEAQEEINEKTNYTKTNNQKTSKIFSQSNNKENILSMNQIIQNSDPYVIFNISTNTTCDEIKSKYKELSRRYNASRGSVNRIDEEQKLLTKTQSKINIAYDFLRKKHCS